MLIEDGMAVGLGSGSTALAFVEALGRRVADGLRLTAVSSSKITTDAAIKAGLEVTELTGRLDIAIDGADVIERGTLSAIKGLGGALTREKLVTLAADRFVLIGDTTKVVDTLDESQPEVPVPVEVIPFGWELTRERLSLYGEPRLRKVKGEPFVTDNGNLILDVYGMEYGQLPDAARAVKEITGVVEHGLFLHMSALAIIGTDEGFIELEVTPTG